MHKLLLVSTGRLRNLDCDTVHLEPATAQRLVRLFCSSTCPKIMSHGFFELPLCRFQLASRRHQNPQNLKTALLCECDAAKATPMHMKPCRRREELDACEDLSQSLVEPDNDS